jgi:tricorn protease
MSEMTPRATPFHLKKGGLPYITLAALSALLWGGVLTPASLAQVALETKHYLRNPAGHGLTVVFEFDDHIWQQQADGRARRITDADTYETAPVLSPDGSLVAYVAVSDSSHEVFVADLASGETSRLTFDGGSDAKVQGWLNSTEVLYSTTVDSAKRGPLLFAVNIQTNRSRAIPLTEAAEGCVLGDDFIFVKNQELIDSNRLYEGGYAQKIYRIRRDLVFGARRAEDQDTNPSIPLTGTYSGISRNPLCIGDRIFFLSDRDKRFNIWSMASDGRDLVQHTFEADYDIRSMTTSDGTLIYYQRGGEIFRLDPSRGPGRRVAVKLPTTRTVEIERFTFDPARASDFVISDDGRRVSLVIRGKLWTLEHPYRTATCVECNSNRRVKSPVTTSDGGTIFALHDASGEYDLYAYDLNRGSVRRLANEIDDPILDFSASPNGRNILVRSIPGDLYHVDGSTGATRRINLTSRSRPNDIVWSADSRFAAFVTYTSNGIGRITAFDSLCRSVTYLTSGRFQVSHPAFSHNGRELFFIAQTNFRSTVDDGWGTANYWPSYDNRSLIYTVDVSALSERRPSVDRSGIGCVSETEEHADCDRKGDADQSMSRRDLLLIRELPFVAGNYHGLSFSSSRLYAFLRRAARDNWGQIVGFSRDLHGTRRAPEIVFNERIYNYVVSATGRAIIARTTSGLFVSSVMASGDFGVPVPLQPIAGLEVKIDLGKEREQMFDEIWRMYRDYFWDPDMAGVDWEKERDKYRAFLPRVVSRAELDEVVAAMVSELGAGHTSPGIPPPGAQRLQGVARLGGDYFEDDGLRVARIFDGDLEIMEERSPLSAANPPVNVGDRLTHVNGVAVSSKFMLDQMLYGRVGENVILRVVKPDGRVVENSIELISAGHETWLRNRAWASTNSALVDELSGRTVGYIHIASAYEADFSSFVRQYVALHQRGALILDLRGNNGGNIDPWLLHFLQRRTWLHVADRNNPTAMRHPRESFAGNLFVLIDGDTYSNGELIAEGVRRLGLGILIGSQTSGAGMWVNDEKILIDGSRLRIPEAGSYYSEKGGRRWVVEGRGVEPDVHVENDPYWFYFGFDAQLRAAVDHAMRVREQ